MKNYLRYALIALGLLVSSQAGAATRFWNPYSVTGAGTGTTNVGQCKLTISPAIVGGGLLVGTSVTVVGITGVTGCNGTFSISAVDDTTHIELAGSTFGAGTFGGPACASGGLWTASNTASWAASSTATCGSGGSSAPGTADTATFDANSLLGTVALDSTMNNATIAALTLGAYNGGLNFNGQNLNISSVGNGLLANSTGSPVITLGSGTLTLNGSTPWDMTNANGSSTFNSGTIVINASGFTGNSASFAGAGKTYGTVKFNSRTNATENAITGSNSFGTLIFNGPGRYTLTSATTNTITGALTITGASNGLVELSGSSTNSTSVATLAVTGATLSASWGAFKQITVTGGPLLPTSSFDLGGNTGITVSAPSSGGSRCIGC
jgi:hypothetical protein